MTGIDTNSGTTQTFIALLVLVLCIAVGGVGCGDPKPGTPTPSTAEAGHDGEHDADHEKGGDEHHHEGEEEGHEGEIRMTPVMMKEAGINVEPVRKQAVTASITSPGRVVPTQNGVAHVGTMIAGRVTRLNVTEGSHVRKGQSLAEIEAVDIGSLKGDFATARAGLEHARSTLARQEKLAGEGVGAQRTLEEARAAHGQAVAALRAAEAKLRSVGINPGSVGTSGTFSSRIQLRSPIDGVVARRTVVLGEYVEPNKDAFEVVNTNTVWIDAQVSPDVAATLATGSAGFVRDKEDHRHTGVIRFIAPTVDPESRTVTVRVEVSNPNVHMRPETFVSVEFERSVAGMALSIPKEAIEQEGSSFYVYREEEEGHFERVPVQIGSDTGDRRVVSAGLEEGARIAVSGIFYLKSARQKGELQEHHH